MSVEQIEKHRKAKESFDKIDFTDGSESQVEFFQGSILKKPIESN